VSCIYICHSDEYLGIPVPPPLQNLYLRLEKENAPEELRKQTDGVSYNKSRPGLKGDYQRYMKDRWDKDPDLRKKYQRLARGPSPVAVNEVDDQDNMDGDPIATLDEQIEDFEEVEMKSTKEVQKKSLKTLKTHVRQTNLYITVHANNFQLTVLERQQINVICVAVPSERLTPVLYLTPGKAFEYWALLCKQGGNASEFESMCRGGKIAESAIEEVKKAAKEGRVKDALRSEVASLVLKAISMYSEQRFEPI
jgi:hypothetical protein